MINIIIYYDYIIPKQDWNLIKEYQHMASNISEVL